MKQWRIKEISDLTGVSVRMLHHYDKIGLLKPSMRSSNGYRWYSELDLATLQKIIALKFFGFSLEAIKTMLQQKQSIQESLRAQQEMLEGQVESLRLALDALDVVLKKYQAAKSLDWKQLIELMERYRMAEEIKNTWAGKLSEKQQERYVVARQKYPKEFQAWEKAVKSINSMQLGDPEGVDGERMMKVFDDFLNASLKWQEANPQKMTSDDAADMMQSIHKHVESFQNKSEGFMLTYEGNQWFAKARTAHELRVWRHLNQKITKNLDVDPESSAGKKVAAQWRAILTKYSAGAPFEFSYGIMLLLQSIRARAALQGHANSPSDDMKLLTDPLALDWVLKALKAH